MCAQDDTYLILVDDGDLVCLSNIDFDINLWKLIYAECWFDLL